MNKNDFFKILNDLIFDEKRPSKDTLNDFEATRIEIDKNIFFMLNRYVSFANPYFTDLVNNLSNNQAIIDRLGAQNVYNLLDVIIPKTSKRYIKFHKKLKNDVLADNDDFIEKYAKKYEISEREAYNMLTFINQKSNN